MELAVVWLLSSAGVFMATVIFGEICVWLRNLMPKTVQCWFCLHKTEVPYSLSNSWHCPQCEQYNGFTKDGDYNKPIHQQYDEKLNFSVSILGRCKNAWKRGRSLCKDCNRNQQLKVDQLANFVPINEKTYDQEIEHFRSQIDKSYKLCPDCDNLVNSVLKKERSEYCMPRALNTPLSYEGRRGTALLYLCILVSLFLALIGFVQTKAASKGFKVLCSLVLPLVKTHAPTLSDKFSTKWVTHFKTVATEYVDCVVLVGAVVSLMVYYRSKKQSIALLFNSLTWLSFMAFSLHWSHLLGAQWFPLCQIVLGGVSSLLSLLVVADIYSEARAYHQRHQALLQCKFPKTFNGTPKYRTPPTTSTPRVTPPQSQSFSYVDSSSVSAKNSSLGLHTTVPDLGLEPAIRGLNLGKKSFRARDDDAHSVWSGVHSNYANGGASVFNHLPGTWSTYSPTPNVSVYPTSVNSPSFMANSTRLMTSLPGTTAYHNLSRSASPTSVVGSQFGAPLNSTFTESSLKQRNLSNTLITTSRPVRMW